MITGWSNSKSEGFFPEFLKRANTTRVHKKNDPLGKENYRPVSILPLFSNVYEKDYIYSTAWVHAIFFKWNYLRVS